MGCTETQYDPKGPNGIQTDQMGLSYLLGVPLGVLDVHQHLPAARVQRLHREARRLQHHVPLRLQPCTQHRTAVTAAIALPGPAGSPLNTAPLSPCQDLA